MTASVFSVRQKLPELLVTVYYCVIKANNGHQQFQNIVLKALSFEILKV